MQCTDLQGQPKCESLGDIAVIVKAALCLLHGQVNVEFGCWPSYIEKEDKYEDRVTLNQTVVSNIHTENQPKIFFIMKSKILTLTV